MNINSANPPLVMVHGWGGSHQETWQKSGVEQLLTESGRTVIGVDLLGHGTAAKPHDPAAYSDISEPIRTAIGARSSTVDAVGFSLGAIALLHAATVNPNYFRRLMLVVQPLWEILVFWRRNYFPFLTAKIKIYRQDLFLP